MISIESHISNPYVIICQKATFYVLVLIADSDLLGFALAGVCLCNLLALRREISIQNVVLYFLAVI